MAANETSCSIRGTGTAGNPGIVRPGRMRLLSSVLICFFQFKPNARSKLPEEADGRVTRKICMKKTKTSYRPIKLIKTEPVVIPTKVLNTPIRVSNGDKAETKSFDVHKPGAGQCKRMKIKILISATKLPDTAARI